MGTQRKMMWVASLLSCLLVVIILGVGKVGGNSGPAGETDAFSAGSALFARIDSSGLQLAAGSRNPVLEPHPPQSMQNSLGRSDIFEEETDGPFTLLNNAASHIIVALSDQSRRSSARMKPAACPARLYLVNSTLLC
ncbi:MAG: hypothetical protein P8010_25170 [Desulfosarcinaceae bacterium]